jgi:hypothetical protein
MSQLSEDLASDIEGADLETLQTAASEETEEDSFADLLSDILSGDTTAEEVDDRIQALLNDFVDIPYVPEGIEGKLLGFAVDGVRAALLQIAQRVG